MANAVITVLESDGTTETDITVLDVGRQAAAASKSTAMSTEDKAVLDAAAASLVSILAKIIATPATEAKQDTMITALQLIDDPVATLGTTTYSEATTKGMIVGAVRRNADTTLVDTTNEVGPLQMNAAGQLKVEAFSGETLPVSLATAPALVAGTALIGKVSASHETNTIYNGTTALTPKFKKIDCSSSGNNEIVAAVSGKKIRVLAWDVSPSDVVNFKWRTASTDITGLYYAANAGNGVSKPFSPVGYFETVSDEALNLNLSAAEAVGGSLVYVEV